MSIFNVRKIEVRRDSLLLTFLFTSVIALVAGCGNGMNGSSFNVSGAVTYDGQPVPVGYIKFIPKGDGATGFASIRDGKYDTSIGKKKRGIEAGEYTIRLDGFDGVPVADPDDPDELFGQGKQLFSRHTIEQTFPAKDQELNIDVPKKIVFRSGRSFKS